MNAPRASAALSKPGHTRVWARLKSTVRQIGDFTARPGQEPGAWEASWSLWGDLSSVPRARRLTRARLTAWGLEGFADVVELLVSELVTNALHHAPGMCRLTLSAVDGLVRCEVEDGSTELPRPHQPGAYEERGRVLYLLDTLACCWGGDRTPTGKVMWFELPTGAPTQG
jgi:hypothetical protein